MLIDCCVLASCMNRATVKHGVSLCIIGYSLFACFSCFSYFYSSYYLVLCFYFISVFFFFQAEDGIRDWSVTGVQTCALPISSRRRHTRLVSDWSSDVCSSDLEEHTSELQSLTNLVCRLLLGVQTCAL